MRIAQVAPLFEAVPPQHYGGTERVVAALTDALTWEGHEVTLFATSDSHANAELVVCREAPIGAGATDTSECADHIMELEKVRRALKKFDIVHFHTAYMHFPMFEDVAGKTVTTCHHRLDFPTLPHFFDRFRAFPLISISDAQRSYLPNANWAATIHHGYPLDQYVSYDRPTRPDAPLAFLGRICPEKGVLDAIEIARASGRKLKIAASVNDWDRKYYETVVKPQIDGNQIEHIGEIEESQKTRFLNEAAALLFPIQWPEPFGLVMIEAMACGTPVIAYDEGSVSEVIENGVTGFIRSNVEEAVAAIDQLDKLDPRKIRKEFERRFSSRKMAENHVELYERLIYRYAQGAPTTMDIQQRILKKARQSARELEKRPSVHQTDRSPSGSSQKPA